jgi:hypothetical protein
MAGVPRKDGVRRTVTNQVRKMSGLRQASMRTLNDSHLESVQVEVRPIGRCYLIIGLK